MTSEDSLLLRRAAEGDQDALAELLRHHGPAIRDSLRGEIPDRWQSLVSVDDVLQETYIEAFLGVAGVAARNETAFRSWLVSIARHNLLDALKGLEAQKRGGGRSRVAAGAERDSAVDLFEQLCRTSSTPSRAVRREELRAATVRAVEELSEPYRTVVRMYDLDDRPVDEVALALERSPGAVYMLRARAHRRLSQLIEERSGGFSTFA